MAPSANIEAFRAILQCSKNIVAVAGAGLSAASGIPTFRDAAGGLWRSYDAMALATPDAFEDNPSLVWQFYHMRREKALRALPNAAHLALAELFLAERIKTIAPSAKFTLVTQNVDGLSVRALQQVMQSPAITSSPSLLEMHGRVLDTVCTECGDREANFDSPICPALAGTELIIARQEEELDIPLEDLPRCHKCKGLLRPGVVWFYEQPHHLKEIDELVAWADVGLIVGTSSTVYPAAGYAAEIQRHGGKTAVFNLDRSQGDRKADFLFLGPCEKTLPEVLFGAQT